MCWTTSTGSGKFAGEPAEDGLEGLRASGGGADPDDPGAALAPVGRMRRPPFGRVRASRRSLCRKATAWSPRRVVEAHRGLGQRLERSCGERLRRPVRAPADVAAQHEDRNGVRGAHDLLDRPDPVHAGQLEVHRHEVGLQARQGLDRLLAGLADPHHLEVAVRLEEAGQATRVGGGVLADQDAGGHGVRHGEQAPDRVEQGALVELLLDDVRVGPRLRTRCAGPPRFPCWSRPPREATGARDRGGSTRAARARSSRASRGR